MVPRNPLTISIFFRRPMIRQPPEAASRSLGADPGHGSVAVRRFPEPVVSSSGRPRPQFAYLCSSDVYLYGYGCSAWNRSFDLLGCLMKTLRHNAIRELVAHALVTNQDELRRKLRRRGFAVTQATLSRDIHELGLSKGPGGYTFLMAPPRQSRRTARPRSGRCWKALGCACARP